VRLRLPVRHQPVRSVEIGELQDTFLVSAIAMILVIRLQLWLTNYPQLGGGKLHIAHLLWGGLFMLVALLMLLSFVGRSLRTPAAVVGGIGFGFFIDELGKFITADNDYFFQPTAALIYLFFIGLFFLTRWMRRRRGFSSREYVMNTMDMVLDAARHDFDEREKRRALELLDRADQSDELVAPLRAFLQEIDALPPREPPWVTRVALGARDRYFRVVQSPRFRGLVGVVFVVWAVVSLVQILALVLSLGFALEGRDAGAVVDRLGGRFDDLSFINLASLASSLTAGALVILGVNQLRTGERLDAYHWFNRALMVQILVTQVFAFVESQFSAVFGLSLDIALLVTLRYMMRGERHLHREAQLPPRAPAPTGPKAEPAAA
jgi:hypothetical protein